MIRGLSYNFFTKRQKLMLRIITKVTDFMFWVFDNFVEVCISAFIGGVMTYLILKVIGG